MLKVSLSIFSKGFSTVSVSTNCSFGSGEIVESIRYPMIPQMTSTRPNKRYVFVFAFKNLVYGKTEHRTVLTFIAGQVKGFDEPVKGARSKISGKGLIGTNILTDQIL